MVKKLYLLVLDRVTIIPMKHHDQKASWEEGSLEEVRTETQARNLEAGAEAEAMEGCRLFCFRWLF